MKKKRIKSSALVGMLTLFLSVSAHLDGLKDITQPHLGEYKCESAVYGEEDMLQRFSYIVIELVDGENFVLRYEDANGNKGEQSGKYKYDRQKGTIRFYQDGKILLKRDFTLKKGKLFIGLPIGNKNLRVTFQQK